MGSLLLVSHPRVPEEISSIYIQTPLSERIGFFIGQLLAISPRWNIPLQCLFSKLILQLIRSSEHLFQWAAAVSSRNDDKPNRHIGIESESVESTAIATTTTKRKNEFQMISNNQTDGLAAGHWHHVTGCDPPSNVTHS